MTVPLFSIVIPTFNRPDYLKVCLESLYDQIPQGNNIEVTVDKPLNKDASPAKPGVVNLLQSYCRLEFQAYLSYYPLP
ncbi:MAG: glycosyltransferase [Gracilibacteraceae bacterium]|nr:glycosyltransferase [Gracilibacteraceae bacterium]